MQAIFVYVTCKDRQEATTIGKAVVEARLAACANILDGMASIYWWEGRLETSNEAVLIFKTSENLLDSLTSKVKSLHSYSVPCVVGLPILGGNPDYLAWIAKETGGAMDS